MEQKLIRTTRIRQQHRPNGNNPRTHLPNSYTYARIPPITTHQKSRPKLNILSFHPTYSHVILRKIIHYTTPFTTTSTSSSSLPPNPHHSITPHPSHALDQKTTAVKAIARTKEYHPPSASSTAPKQG